MGNEDLIGNSTTYNFDDKNSLSFQTRKKES